MRYSIGLLALLLTGCSHLWHGSSAACSPSPSEDTAVTPDRVSQLSGRYRVTQVTTSFSDDPRVSELILTPPDSATRARAIQRYLGHAPRRDLRLVGTWRWSSKYPAEPAEWDAGTLYLGCRDCMDGSPDHLHIEALTEQGFRGTWIDYQSGIGRLIDKHGQPLPNPAGYFCADYLGKAL